MNINNMLLVYYGIKNNCINDIIILIAILENCENDINKYIDNKNDDYNNEYFIPYIIKNSDHLTILNIYYNLYLVKKNKLLNIRLWDKIEEKIKDIKNNILKLKINYEDEKIENKYDKIK